MPPVERTALATIAAQEMRAQGLEPDFPAAALAQAEVIGRNDRAAGGDIRDLRHQPWFSIDNDDTQDLDQLSWAHALPGGAVRLAVAVADVDARVPQGSPVDAHAAVNTTSVYTAGGVFPMLPPRLSNDLTSLHEDQERLAVVVEMTIDASGALTASQLYRACVRNQAKLAYGSVSAWLDGHGSAPAAVAASAGLATQLQLHDGVAKALRQWRQRRGALNV
ncbi:MAG: RNB domain-containing ribonuclease, partial [Burkholderiaceae bacterium]